jgi:cell division protein FtsL
MKGNKKNKFKKEKLLLFIIICLIIFTPFFHVLTKAKLSETNIQVEKLKDEIEEQKKVNESLDMKINELASLDKIREIAEENGLSYQNNNIKIINKE